MHMPGMTMPAPAKPTPKTTAKKKSAPKKMFAKKAATPATKPAATAPAHDPAAAPAENPQPSAAPMDHSQMDQSQMDQGVMPRPMDHSQTGAMPMGDMQGGEHVGHNMAMTGAFGSYPMARESSGTAWQPDNSEHNGLHVMSGDWTLMAHGVVNLVYDHQSGRRGDDKFFGSGMVMGTA